MGNISVNFFNNSFANLKHEHQLDKGQTGKQPITEKDRTEPTLPGPQNEHSYQKERC